MAAESLWRTWRREVHDILEVGGDAYPIGRVVNGFIIVLIILNAVAFAAETVDHLAARYATFFYLFNIFSVAVFSVEYLLRLWSAVDIPMLSRMQPWKARLRFAAKPIMLIDLFAVLPFYFQWLIPIDLRALRVLRLFRLLKLVRYSPALQTLGRVLSEEYRALLGALLVMLVLLLFASTGIYFLEHNAQPDKFGSIPAAAWWAIATLTTVGYGDVAPITPWGKVLGGVVMLLGVGMFALPIAIIASGFSLESARHQFLEHGSAASAVCVDEPRGNRRDHQSALHAQLCAGPAHRPVRRCRQCDVHHRERRGGRVARRRQNQRAERGRFLRRDGAARAQAAQT
jgi:voltage-gated potassium channel